jgi:hypothetical protein
LNKVKEADQTPDSSSNRKMIHTGLPKDNEEDVTNLDQGSP